MGHREPRLLPRGDGLTSGGDFATLREDPQGVLTSVRCGTVRYAVAWAWQRELVRRRQEGLGRDTLLLLEHPRVYTAGRRADEANLLFDAAERTKRGIEVHHVDRGGDFTYHGPGQLVGYPILKLSGPRVVDHVRALEEVGIRVADSYGIAAGRVEGMSGVWVGDQKLMAIGVRVSAGYVTQHGMALNVHPDLADFTGIVPCGLPGKGVCSLASLGIDTTLDEVAGRYEQAFVEVYGGTVEHASPGHLDLPDEPVAPEQSATA